MGGGDRRARGGRRITPAEQLDTTPGGAVRARVESHELVELREGWEAACSAPAEHTGADSLDGLSWQPAAVPGSAAGVLAATGAAPWEIAAEALDGKDWWFRTSFVAMGRRADAEEVVLVFDGIATVAEVYLNGRRIHHGSSMFERACVEVGDVLAERNQLVICCRALTPLLALSRRPRARWRTRVVAEGGLRFFRTMLIGRAPGFAPGPAVVGPWRPVRLERRRALVVTRLELRPCVAGADGVLSVRLGLRVIGAGAPQRVLVDVDGGAHGRHRSELELVGGDGRGEVAVPDVALWWPHTHGEPTLYAVRLLVDLEGETHSIDAGRVGFRTIEGGGERLEQDGLQLRVNGESVFARGAVWTPLEAGGDAPSVEALAALLGSLRDAGLNMVRIPGVGAYESAAFHDLCDELGILVWQDFMFANLDYPESDPEFLDVVAAEVRQVLAELGGRPSLVVLCGSSEVAQQVAMLGLDPGLADGPLFGELLPGLVAASGVDAIYVPSAPWGGELPFRPDRGVANYYGIGAYRRPLDDARMSGVRFASECLAFANVPEQDTIDELAGGGGAPAVHDPRWKAGVPRDLGTGWDFDDLRDHYLAALYGIDPFELRAVDTERYLELSRAVTGEVMAAAFGEWRRADSPCGGAIVQWLRDLRPGAGWGILDHRGAPKVAYHHLRRALAPVAVWSTDEGLSGIAVHVANDRPSPLLARLRVALYSNFEIRVEEVERELELAPRSSVDHGVEELLGRFVDVSWAYRFGPPTHDVIALSLHDPEGRLLSQSFRLPVGRPLAREASAQLGLTATVTASGAEAVEVAVRSRRFAYGVRVNFPGFTASDDAFSVEPGGERRIELVRGGSGATAAAATLTALNLAGRVPITLEAAS